ncbi:MAG: transcriptional regulator [Haloplanus sp.]
MDATTTRERIAAILRSEAATATDLSPRVGASRAAVFDHLEHVARSLDGTDEELLVAPPECRDCGFDGFDHPLADPSRCPNCRSENVAEPTFVVE